MLLWMLICNMNNVQFKYDVSMWNIWNFYFILMKFTKPMHSTNIKQVGPQSLVLASIELAASHDPDICLFFYKKLSDIHHIYGERFPQDNYQELIIHASDWIWQKSSEHASTVFDRKSMLFAIASLARTVDEHGKPLNAAHWSEHTIDKEEPMRLMEIKNRYWHYQEQYKKLLANLYTE